MVWTALCVGVVAFVIVSRVAGRMRRTSTDLATHALRTLGASGMFGLTAVTAAAGSFVASAVAVAAAVALTVDLTAIRRRLVPGLAERHAATATPFQNAT